MKKVFLLCMVFVFSNTIFAQTRERKAKEILSVDSKKEAAAKEAKAKKILNTKESDKKVVLKKDGTPDKRYKVKSNNASARGQEKSAAGKAKAASNKAEAKVKERVSNEKAPKVRDKVTGTYNGKKVYTGPRGGKYYINSNGNKTYISDDK